MAITSVPHQGVLGLPREACPRPALLCSGSSGTCRELTLTLRQALPSSV